MTFSKKITLFNMTTPYGTAKPEPKDLCTVWCSISAVGSTTSINALSVGKKLTNQVEMWLNDYKGQGYATLDGKEYKIEIPAQARNPLKIKLLLSRG